MIWKGMCEVNKEQAIFSLYISWFSTKKGKKNYSADNRKLYGHWKDKVLP